MNFQFVKIKIINIIQNFEFFLDRKMENLSKQHGGVYEILYYQKNGQGIWLQEEIVSIRNEQNIIVLFLVTFRDITPFKEPLEGQSVMSNLSKFARLAWTITRARPNNNLAPSRYVPNLHKTWSLCNIIFFFWPVFLFMSNYNVQI